MNLNSIIFHTTRLADIRKFYEDTLKLQIGTYLKNGSEVSDHSESYVNYRVGSVLLCFESDAIRTDLGTVVISVLNFHGLKKHLQEVSVEIISEKSHYFKVKDPEGRSLIIEPIN